MSTETVLVIDGTDFSEMITENDMKVKYTPVYDESTSFTAMDGNTVKKLLGYRAAVSVDFSALDNASAQCLSALLDKEKFSMSFASPDIKTAQFEMASLTVEPEGSSGDEMYWTAYLSASSEVMPLSGL